MAKRGNVRVSITGDSSGLGRATRDAENKLDRMDRSGSKSLRALGTAAKAGGVALVAGLAVGAKKAADAAIDAEVSMAKMRAQLRAIGQDNPQVRAEIDKSVQSLSLLTGLDDEDLQASFTNIVRVTGNVTQSLKLNAVAADLARAKGLDLAKAGDIIAKVAGGNTGILARYGFVLKDGATSQEALAAVQQKFAGQAKSYGETTAGAVDRTNVAFENLGEVVGGVAAPLIQKAANGLAVFIGQVNTGTGAGGEFRRSVEQIAGVVGRLAAEIGPVALGIARFAGGLISSRAGIVALTAVAGALVGRMAALGVALAVQKVQAFIGALGGLRAAFMAARGGAIALNAATVTSGLGALLVVVGTVVGALAGYSATSKKAGASSREVADAVKAERDALKRLNDLDLEATQRRLDFQNATLRVQRAEQNLTDLRRSGHASALDIKEAENELRQARVDQERAQRNLRRTEGDANETRKDAIRSLQDEINTRKSHVSALTHEIAEMILQGRSSKDIERKAAEAAREQRALNKAINDLRSKRIVIEIEQRLTGRAPAVAGQLVSHPKLAPGAAGRTVDGVSLPGGNTPALFGTSARGSLNHLIGAGGQFELQTAEQSVDTAQAASTATLDDDKAAIARRLDAIDARFRQINAALKRYLKKLRDGKKKVRLRYAQTIKDLYSEKAALVDEVNTLNGSLAAMNATPEPVDIPAADTGGGADTPAPPADTPAETPAPSTTEPDRDLQAQLDQANARTAVQAEKARLSEATLRAFSSAGDIGSGGFGSALAAAQGGPVIVVNTLHPGDPQTLNAIGQAATAGIGYQGAQGSPRALVGV